MPKYRPLSDEEQEAIQQAQNAPAEVRTISDKTTYDKLPKEFTYADVKNAKGHGYSDSSYRSSVSRWKKFNLIEEVRVGIRFISK